MQTITIFPNKAEQKEAFEFNKLEKRLTKQVGQAIADFNMIEEWTEEDEKFWSGSASKGQTNMKVGDKVKVVANELQGVIIELFPAVDDWKETAMVSFPNGKQVEYELIDLEVK